jgi:hypothetical protein
VLLALAGFGGFGFSRTEKDAARVAALAAEGALPWTAAVAKATTLKPNPSERNHNSDPLGNLRLAAKIAAILHFNLDITAVPA